MTTATAFVSQLDPAAIHNALATLTQAYGHLLAEQERRIQLLSAQLRATQEDAKRLSAELVAAKMPER